MKPKEGLLKCGTCTVALALLTGCLPYPHTTPRSWEISGTVLDARTRAPIKGAKAVQSEGETVDSPKTRTRTTDAAGHFKLKVSHNFHLAITGLGEGRDWPPPHYYEVVTISYPGYLSYEITGWVKEMTVLLEPVDGLELQGRVLDARTSGPIGGARVYFNECMRLSCISDATGHFRLKATPEFYQEFMASQASGRPFRDQVTVSRGDLGWVSFHWGDPWGTSTWGVSTNIIIQPVR